MYACYVLSLLPWPCGAVAVAHAGAADHGFSQRPGPLEVSGSHSTPCREPPCTCGESPGNFLCPAERQVIKEGLERSKVRNKAEGYIKRKNRDCLYSSRQCRICSVFFILAHFLIYQNPTGHKNIYFLSSQLKITKLQSFFNLG